MTGAIFRGHGLGNDYLSLEPVDLEISISRPVVRLLCDRHRGIGSDGLLVRVPSDVADVGLRIHNPDGSEAEKSGNGLRIFAAYLYHVGWCGADARFTVETPGGVVHVSLLGRDPAGALLVRVHMGLASFLAEDVGLADAEGDVSGVTLALDCAGELLATLVSVGNPHCVLFRDALNEPDLRSLGPRIAAHERLPRGVNVQLARALDRHTLEALVWERGVGETLASGSSACAVAAAAVRTGRVSPGDVEVRMPGGALRVRVEPDWAVHLMGPAEAIAEVRLLPGFIEKLSMVGRE